MLKVSLLHRLCPLPHAWRVQCQKSESRDSVNNLYGVAAASASDVWAVGSYSNDPQNQDVQTLIEHWNGSSWSIVPGLNPGAQGNAFNAVTTVSASNVWAVGFSYNSTLRGRITLHPAR